MIQRFGTDYGHFHCDPDLIPRGGVILDLGVGTDMSFTEELHALRPDLTAVLVDHMDESENFVKVVRGYPWVKFIKAAVAPHGTGLDVTMFHHRTGSGSESIYADHLFTNPRSSYKVPAVSVTYLIDQYHPSIIKCDCEGIEFDVYKEMIGIPQLCMEWHHRMMSGFKKEDYLRAVKDLDDAGYSLLHRTETDETLFIHRGATRCV